MIKSVHTKGATTHAAVWRALEKEKVVMKRSIMLSAVSGWLLASGGGSLLAEKGQGKLGAPGLEGALPPLARKSKGTHRAEVEAPSGSASANNSANANVSTRLANNPTLSARIQPLLPAGFTVATASAGFRNQGQFIAALHVSRNLGIPFDQLKAELTERHPDSLGQAVHDLRPDLSRSTVRGDVRMAKLQAEQDIDAAELAIRLSTNATLATRAQALLPAGTSLQNAAVGFEDARQFLLVEHVAHDLNISFAQLKAEVTGANPVPLKEAVSGLRPDLTAATIRSDLAVARQETKVDLQAAGVLVEEQKEIARE
jgi:hypothetical protein